MTGMLSQLRGGWQRAVTRRQATRFSLAAQQVHGPVPLVVDNNEAVVLITQWRVSDLDAFFTHYRRLGLRHFVFFGAHAPEDALVRIKEEPGTIIVENGLRVAVPEEHVLGYLSETYGRDRWCLTVSTDQLLEFEGAATLGLSGLIGYLKAQHATALIAHQLEMFPKGALGQIRSMDLTQKVDACVYFDITKLKKTNRPMPDQSDEDKDATPPIYADSAGALISLYPLVFNRTGVTLQPAPLAPEGVRYAGISAVLKSYRNAISLGETKPETQLFSLSARRWNRAALLVRAGFLQGSDAYTAWIKEHSA